MDKVTDKVTDKFTDNPKKISTYICGCVRNCAQYLPTVFANIAKITPLFDDYKIVIAYDNSTDKSLRILCDMKRQFPKLEILINRNATGSIRTQNIANARNELLRYMRADRTFDYFIMIDMDDVCAGNMNVSVLQKYIDIERNNNTTSWDALSFNRPCYYDAWALSIEPYVFSCWHFPKGREVVMKMRDYISKKLQSNSGNLLECMSAFNGFAIYRLSAFDGVIYEWDVRKNVEIIHNCAVPLLIENTAKAVGQPLSWHRGDDCEHRYFHIRATQQNGARICISPEILFTDYVDG